MCPPKLTITNWSWPCIHFGKELHDQAYIFTEGKIKVNFTIYHNDEDQMRIRQREHCCADGRGIQNRFMLCRNSQHQAKHSHGSLYACFYIYLFNLCFYHKPPLMCFSIYQETHIYQHTHTQRTIQKGSRITQCSGLTVWSCLCPRECGAASGIPRPSYPQLVI